MIIAVWSRSLEESGTAEVDLYFYFLLHFISRSEDTFGV